MESSTQKKTDSNVNKGVGNVKETAGNLTGSNRLESEGKAQNQAGQAQGMGAKITESLENAKNTVTGAFSGAGKAHDNSQSST